MLVEIFFWNCQGAGKGRTRFLKWEIAKRHLYDGLTRSKNVIFFMEESGEPKFMKKEKNIFLRRIYFNRFNRNKSEFVSLFQRDKPDRKKDNFRCSLGGMYFLSNYLADISSRKSLYGRKSTDYLRDFIRFELRVGKNISIIILQTHLNSGGLKKTKEQFEELLRSVKKSFEGIPFIILGDLNINLLNYSEKFDDYGDELADRLKKDWSVLRIKRATQKSGGELDFALFYHMNRFDAPIIEEVTRFKTPLNPADHSILKFTVDMGEY